MVDDKNPFFIHPQSSKGSTSTFLPYISPSKESYHSKQYKLNELVWEWPLEYRRSNFWDHVENNGIC